MRVQPLPQGTGVAEPRANVQVQDAARAKAIAMLTAQPVPNATKISPEETGAIRSQVQKPSLTDTQPISEETQVLETAQVEDQPEAVSEPAKDPLSSQYALLARKEKALRAKAQQQEATLRQREEALKAREAALEGRQPQDLSNYVSKDDIKRQTLKVLADANVSYDELTQQILNTNPTDPRTESLISRLEAKIAKLEEANDNSQKNMSKREQESRQAAVNQIKVDVKQLVFTDPAFEMVKATNSVNDVVELIEKTYDQKGYVLSVEDAAQQVEDYLADEALKLARLSKIQNRLKPVARANTNSNAQTPQSNKQSQPMKTLTNASASSRPLSARERALLAFKGELKP